MDANQAYSRTDAKYIAKFDDFNLLLIEQPLDEHDVLGHVLLSKKVKTPICLDESITSLQTTKDALALKATSVINIKPGRVGGYFESVKIHNLLRIRFQFGEVGCLKLELAERRILL